MNKPLYDTDFYAWTQEQAEAIRAKNVAALDIEHLAEEVEDLGRNVRHAIVSQLERLLLHLLKWRYDPATDPRRLWRLSILLATFPEACPWTVDQVLDEDFLPEV
jgi:hypothetical protein